MNASQFELDSKFVGALPLVNHYLAKIGLHRYMEKHLPTPDRRASIAPAVVLGIIVRNLVLARDPLYSLREWAEDKAPGLIGLTGDQVRLLNDDRMGRALDTLFDADRAAILTDIIVNTVRVFGLSLEQFNNDSTSLTLYGQYRQATGTAYRGKPTLAITFGHSKDHRPDLKQLVFILTTSSDGTVPVHFKVADGNTEDSTTHIETWEHLRTIVGSADFLYVADCKLCTRANLKYIDQRHGRFVTIMPRSRKEDKLFKDWLLGCRKTNLSGSKSPESRTPASRTVLLTSSGVLLLPLRTPTPFEFFGTLALTSKNAIRFGDATPFRRPSLSSES